MILLDTNVVVAHLKGDSAVTARLTDQIESIAIPALVVAELDYGAKASARPTENLARLASFLDGIEIVPFDDAAARHLHHLHPCRRVAVHPAWMERNDYQRPSRQLLGRNHRPDGERAA